MLWKNTRVLNLALEPVPKSNVVMKAGHALSASDHLVQHSVCDTVGSNSQHTIWAGLRYSNKTINTHAIMIIPHHYTMHIWEGPMIRSRSCECVSTLDLLPACITSVVC